MSKLAEEPSSGTHTLRAVIFDLDGVLLDSLETHLKFARRMADKFQRDLRFTDSAAEFKASVAKSHAKISPMLNFFLFLGFTPENAVLADRDYRQDFKDEPIELFPGVVDALSRLGTRGLKLGIVTSNVRQNLQGALSRWLFRFDRECIFADDDQPKRTKAEAISAAVCALGLRPSEVVFVGDQKKDYEAAQEAGVRFLGVTYGWEIGGQTRDAPPEPFDTTDTPEGVAEYIEGASERVSCASTIECAVAWKMALDHGRQMFTYHAGQRHTSINFYFIALAIVMAGYGGLLTVDNARFAAFVPFVGIALGLTGAVISVCFWVLDCRNARLVECDEGLLKAAERVYARAIAAPEFETIVASDARTWLTYGKTMPFLFMFLIGLNLAAVAGFVWLGLSS